MRFISFIIGSLVLSSFGFSDTINVPNQYSTIQQAIDVAVNGDIVLVDDGTYVENINFKGKAIIVTSVNGADFTVIDGGSPADPNLASAVVFQNGEGLNSVIEGFTLTNGTGTYYAPWNCHCGGGVFCDPTSCPTIRNNNICGNTLPTGESGGVCSFNAVITDNKIFDNTSFWSGAGVSAGGGNYEVVISNNKIFNNTCTGWCGGGLAIADLSQGTVSNNEIYGNYAHRGGGGLVFTTCSTLIENNLIYDNVAGCKVMRYGGGGILCIDFAEVTIKNNFIMNNISELEGGGGISCRNSSPILLNNFICNNSAETGGGIDVFDYSSVTMTSNTFYGNHASKGGSIACRFESSSVITDTIHWQNTAAIGPEIYIAGSSYPSTVTISYSDLKGGQADVYISSNCTLNWGAGMIDDDPLFLDPLNDDFHLSYASPCIDTGDNFAPSLSALDYEGDRRIFPGNGKGYIVGSPPLGAIVDMGADEYCLLKRQSFVLK